MMARMTAVRGARRSEAPSTCPGKRSEARLRRLRRTLRRILPLSLQQRIRRLQGWAYWTRRQLARTRARGEPEMAAADLSRLPSIDSTGLPEGTLGCVLATNPYGAYCVPRSLAVYRNRRVARAILDSRVWEAETLELLRGVDPDGDIVHAGAFFGDFLPGLARSRRSEALLWAFEPNRENYRCAAITALLNDLDNVRLAHAALGARPGTALLATRNPNDRPLGGASRLVSDPSRTRWTQNEEVRVVTVDQAVATARRVVAVHLDIEGHEQAALEGAMATIKRCKPLIALETLPAADWLATHLTPLGYQVDGKVNINFLLRCR
jgi:FkbM family methyltransferase